MSIGATSPSRRSPPVQRHLHLCSYRTNVTLTPEKNGHSQHDGRGSGSDQVPSKSDWGTAETPCVCVSFDPAGDGRTRLRQWPPWRDGLPTPLVRARCRLSGPSGRLWRVAGFAHLGRQRGEGLVGHAHSRTIGPSHRLPSRSGTQAGIEPAMVADQHVTLGSARPVHSMSTHMHSGVQRPSGGLTALRSRVSRRRG